MTTAWNGNGSIPFATSGAGVRIPIAGVSNATPQVVTTTFPHGYLTGDTVAQEGTGGVADGTYQITRTGTNTYILNGTTASGTAGSGGYAIDYEIQPAFSFPANGVLADANDVVALGEGLSNAIPWMYSRTGQYRLYNEYELAGGNTTVPFLSNLYSSNSPFTATTFVALASTTVTMQSLQALNSTIAPVWASGDLLEYSVNGTAYLNMGLSSADAFLVDVGPALIEGSTIYPLNGSTIGQPSGVSGQTTFVYPFSGTGVFKIASLATTPTAALSFCIAARINYNPASFTTPGLDLGGALGGQFRQLRAN